MQDFCEDYRNLLTNIDSSVGKESAYNAGDTRDAGSILDQKDPLEEGLGTCSNILA